MSSTCTIEDCERRVHGRGLCGAHWRRWKVYGDPLGGGPARQAAPKECVVESCDRKPHARGLCSRHWKADKLAKDPEYRERKNAAWREWAADHAEELAESQRRYRAENADQVAERMRRWRAQNAPWLLAASWTRRRRLYGLPDDVIEMVDPNFVFVRDGSMCRLCGDLIDPALRFPDPLAWTVDHVVPVRDPESTHSYANVVLAHFACNRRKQLARVEVIRSVSLVQSPEDLTGLILNIVDALGFPPELCADVPEIVPGVLLDIAGEAGQP